MGAHPVTATAAAAAIAAGGVSAGLALAGTPGGQTADVQWQGTVTLHANDWVDLDKIPPAITPAVTTTSDLNLFVGFFRTYNYLPSLAAWTKTTPPSASDCQKLIAASGTNEINDLLPGDQFCLSTHNGDYVYLKLTQASSQVVTASTTIFKPPSAS